MFFYTYRVYIGILLLINYFRPPYLVDLAVFDLGIVSQRQDIGVRNGVTFPDQKHSVITKFL